MTDARRALAGTTGLASYADARRALDLDRSGKQLARYVDQTGRTRAVLACPGAGGSVLVLDADLATRRDRRLVAHLAADEAVENAALICRAYMEDVRRGRHRCRALTFEDHAAEPFADEYAEVRPGSAIASADVSAADERFMLASIDTGMSIPELRWCAIPSDSARDTSNPGGGRIVCLREVVAKLQSYDPARALTQQCLRCHGADPSISTSVLRYELLRVQNSPIVLNRALREAVLAVVARGQLSMSEIAMRCGRVKRDAAGSESGETSWLARRIGLLPEAGRRTPTPWVHSDVLALIAREGLGVRPLEVELG